VEYETQSVLRIRRDTQRACIQQRNKLAWWLNNKVEYIVMIKWEPIETAPKDRTTIDLWMTGPQNKDGNRVADCWWQSGKWVTDYGRDGIDEAGTMVGDYPTHWMPIPGSPYS
jgi:hypothetical protein